MKDKMKLIAIFGESGSGKSTLLSAFPSEEYNKIVGTTTRPMREGEVNGVDYNFVTDEQFKAMQFLESRSFRGWYYGTSAAALSKDKVNVGIFNPAALAELVEYPVAEFVDVYPVYLEVSGKERLLRQLNREENPDCKEICRRYLADLEDFDIDKITWWYLAYTPEMPLEDIIKDISHFIQIE